MQLIFETEHTAHIKGNMSTLEESVGDKLINDAIMNSIKHISNGNKENIEQPDNITRNENKPAIKLDVEESNVPIVEIDLEKVVVEKVTDKHDVNCNPEELINNIRPDATESQDCDDAQKYETITEQDQYSQEGNSKCCGYEEKGESGLVQKEVDDILPQSCSILINRDKNEENDQNNTTEYLPDKISEITENPIDIIEAEEMLEDDNTTAEATQESSSPVETDAKLPESYDVTVNDIQVGVIEENQAVYEFDITQEVGSSNLKEAKFDINSQHNGCSKSGNVTETGTVQDDNYESIEEEEAILDINSKDNECSESANVTETVTVQDDNYESMEEEEAVLDINSKDNECSESANVTETATIQDDNDIDNNLEGATLDINSKDNEYSESAKDTETFTVQDDNDIDDNVEEAILDINSKHNECLESANVTETVTVQDDNDNDDNVEEAILDINSVDNESSGSANVTETVTVEDDNDIDDNVEEAILDINSKHNKCSESANVTETVTVQDDNDNDDNVEGAILDINSKDNECSEIAKVTETFTVQDDNDDIVDNTVSEPMDVDEVSKAADIISDKEDNEIRLLDSPINTEAKNNKEESNSSNDAMDCRDVSEEIPRDNVSENIDKENPTKDKPFVASKDKVKIVETVKENSEEINENQITPPLNPIEKEPEKPLQKNSPVICRLSNTLNILSDDEDEPPKTKPLKETPAKSQCINVEDDDDIMLIDEDINTKDSKTDLNKTASNERESVPKGNGEETDLETGEKTTLSSVPEASTSSLEEATPSASETCATNVEKLKATEGTSETEVDKPLLPDNFLKSSKKSIADMTREDLEEFCILKIVESIVDRSNLSEIKTKLKAMALNLEDYRKKIMMLTKQNTDLEVVLKSVQEEQIRTNGAMVTPLKITRSVGMQVFMTDRFVRKKSVVPTNQAPLPAPIVNRTRSSSNIPPKPNKVPSNPTTIPVPRLIPANNAAIRGPVPQVVPASSVKQPNFGHVNGIRVSASPQKVPEKRPIAKSQSVTVDLTDDEPPAKIAARGPTPPVRLVPSQNLLAPQRPQLVQSVNTPRKVYIPISGPQGQQIKPGQTIMVKTSPTGPNRQRPMAPTITRVTTNQMRMNRVGQTLHRHPAALPDVVKQYQPANWKALPPPPDLKLSKVENGIVISWKIESYQEDSYEEIASYQLYAYQETSSPPSTALWKKIGDVKALPLPMACTLTQFMAGFKYYFAVRAVDVKSRVGPFSLPGSILLLNKM